MGSTSYKLICMSMKWHFNATLYFHYCCCFVAIVGAIEELEVHGEGDAGNAQGMGCEMRTGIWSSSQATSYVLWQHVKPIYFDMKHINLYLIHFVLRSSPLCFVYTQTMLNKKVWSHFLGLETQHQHPVCLGLFWLYGIGWECLAWNIENIRYPMKHTLNYI